MVLCYIVWRIEFLSWTKPLLIEPISLVWLVESKPGINFNINIMVEGIPFKTCYELTWSEFGKTETRVQTWMQESRIDKNELFWESKQFLEYFRVIKLKNELFHLLKWGHFEKNILRPLILKKNVICHAKFLSLDYTSPNLTLNLGCICNAQ